MVRLARTEPGVFVAQKKLDADPWLLNVMNGTIDLRTGELSDRLAQDATGHIERMAKATVLSIYGEA